MVDGFEAESSKKKVEGRGSSANIPAVMFTRADRLFQHLCLRIDGYSRELKKRRPNEVEKFGPLHFWNLPFYLLQRRRFNDDFGRRGEIARATLRELCIFDESESLSLLLLLVARVFEGIVIRCSIIKSIGLWLLMDTCVSGGLVS